MKAYYVKMPSERADQRIASIMRVANKALRLGMPGRIMVLTSALVWAIMARMGADLCMHCGHWSAHMRHKAVIQCLRCGGQMEVCAYNECHPVKWLAYLLDETYGQGDNLINKLISMIL